MDSPALPDLAVTLEHQVDPEVQDLRVMLEPQDAQVHQDPPDPLDHQEDPDLQEHQVVLDRLDQLDHLAPQELKFPQLLLALLVTLVPMVKMV